MSPGIEAVSKLSRLGFAFEVSGDRLRYRYQGFGEPDPHTVRPLLDLVKAHKPDVLAYLRKPAPTDRVITCYECGHFSPAVNSPNPTQAWGHCRKRERGRYGAAMACEVIMTLPDAPAEAIYSKTRENMSRGE
jgi:hypothetical protein